MKKIILAVFAVAMVSGCSVNNSDRVDFDANKVLYKYDQRTELCYAVTASRKFGSTDTTGLGVANVPCTDKVMELISN